MAPEPTRFSAPGGRPLRGIAWAVPVAILALCLPVRAVAAPAKPGAQLAFGAQMAQRGLWAEAKFRFEQAAKLDPSNARALGNLAVAYEALGRFDDARATYTRALQVEPGNVEIKRNQARFEEFFASFKGGKDAKPAAPAKEPEKKEKENG